MDVNVSLNRNPGLLL